MTIDPGKWYPPTVEEAKHASKEELHRMAEEYYKSQQDYLKMFRPTEKGKESSSDVMWIYDSHEWHITKRADSKLHVRLPTLCRPGHGKDAIDLKVVHPEENERYCGFCLALAHSVRLIDVEWHGDSAWIKGWTDDR